MALTGAFLGVMATLGILLVVSGWRGVVVVERPVRVSEKRPLDTAVLMRRTLIAVGCFTLFWLLTGWPMAGSVSRTIAPWRVAASVPAATLDRAMDERGAGETRAARRKPSARRATCRPRRRAADRGRAARPGPWLVPGCRPASG